MNLVFCGVYSRCLGLVTWLGLLGHVGGGCFVVGFAIFLG